MTSMLDPNDPRLKEKLTPELDDSAPVRPGPNQLTGHSYDGISEYDNPTPGWWHLIFIATIAFSFLYIVMDFASPMMKTPQESWARMQVLENKRLFGKFNLDNDEASIHKMMSMPDMMTVASGMFQNNCSACHARDGGGINGVNLTDDHYKNIKTLTDIYPIIANGAGNGAMPAWSSSLSKNEIVLLSAYVASLRGTTPALPKAAEGEKIAPWPKGQLSAK
jgi:cytochrome c oxidase cbb3-type subunit III